MTGLLAPGIDREERTGQHSTGVAEIRVAHASGPLAGGTLGQAQGGRVDRMERIVVGQKVGESVAVVGGEDFQHDQKLSRRRAIAQVPEFSCPMCQIVTMRSQLYRGKIFTLV